jgi:hypothetical protein
MFGKTEGKRSIERRKSSEDYSNGMNDFVLGMGVFVWIYPVQDRDRCGAFVNLAMKSRIP